MSVLRTIPMDGTFDQLAPIRRLLSRGGKNFWSFDLSAATDRFPLKFQEIVVECLFNRATSLAWVRSGLGLNIFSAPYGKQGSQTCYLRFKTGQPDGLLSFLSEPLFALCHHIVVWLAADMVFPYRKFSDYALLGDDIVIGDEAVALRYKELIGQLGVKISLPKSLISNSGFLEFTKRFVSSKVDLSPISAKMLRSVKHAIAFIPVFQKYGVCSLQMSLRLRGAGYRRFTAQPHSLHKFSRHWLRHILVMLSPCGIIPLPLPFFLVRLAERRNG